MKIDGREIAARTLHNLSERTNTLNSNGIFPHMYIILMSEDPSTISYIKQKQLRAQEIGAKVTVDMQSPTTSTKDITTIIESLNLNHTIHGIILQRPVPSTIDSTSIDNIILPVKEIDGFGTNSKYLVPVAGAIEKILMQVHEKLNINLQYIDWLKLQKIAILGKGETAGKPIANYFSKLSIQPVIIDSKTQNSNEIVNTCNIVISAVGKENVISPSSLKQGVVLIGVGMHVDQNGKFKGDYNEEEISDIASFYTTTPGGVGPINVACLLENLVKSAETQL